MSKHQSCLNGFTISIVFYLHQSLNLHKLLLTEKATCKVALKYYISERFHCTCNLFKNKYFKLRASFNSNFAPA